MIKRTTLLLLAAASCGDPRFQPEIDNIFTQDLSSDGDHSLGAPCLAPFAGKAGVGYEYYDTSGGIVGTSTANALFAYTGDLLTVSLGSWEFAGFCALAGTGEDDTIQISLSDPELETYVLGAQDGPAVFDFDVNHVGVERGQVTLTGYNVETQSLCGTFEIYDADNAKTTATFSALAHCLEIN